MRVFKFYPEHRAKFHFGEGGGILKELVSSDQLFSAIYNTAVMLYGSNEKENPLLNRLLTMSFSSLYYGLNFLNQSTNESRELFFLPRPLAPVGQKNGIRDLLGHKKAKKIGYLSRNAFKLLISSWQDQEQFFDFNLLELEVIGGEFACTKEELKFLKDVLTDSKIDYDLEKLKVYKIETVPKVVVSRANDQSDNFYFQQAVELTHHQLGPYRVRPFFYFICQGEADKELTAVVRILADEGLGGMRSQGFGLLGTVVEEEWDRQILNGQGQYYLSLSSTYPCRDEVDKLVYYELGERSGYIHSKYGRSLRKKRVRLLQEGSVFSGKISGQIIDLSPDSFQEHKVYLNGKAFLVPLGAIKV
jgi:CRISPR-associated protein Csm4